MWFFVALGVLALLLCMPVRIQAKYDALGPAVTLFVGFVPISLYPGKRKDPSDDVKKGATKAKTAKGDNRGGNWTDFLPLVKAIIAFLEDFRHKIRITKLRMRLVLGAADPCDLSLQYGYGWAALGNLIPLLEQAFMIKKRDLEVECDYTASQTTICACACISILVWQLLHIVLRHGPGAIKEYLNIANKRKGGANL